MGKAAKLEMNAPKIRPVCAVGEHGRCHGRLETGGPCECMCHLPVCPWVAGTQEGGVPTKEGNQARRGGPPALNKARRGKGLGGPL